MAFLTNDFFEELLQIRNAANDSPRLAWIVNHEQWFRMKMLRNAVGDHYWEPSVYHNAGVLFGYPIILDNSTEKVHMAITEFENGTEKLSAREKRHASCNHE